MSAGIKAARALLSLIEENTAEDFEAAESVLGAEQDLVQILDLLRRYKDQEEEPFGVAQLREVVRREVPGLGLAEPDLLMVVDAAVPFRLRAPPAGLTAERVLDQAFERLEAEAPSPPEEVAATLHVLTGAFQFAGQEAKLLPLLSPLATRALVENVTLFPTLHALAALRKLWAKGEALPFQPHESRRKVVARLCADAGQLGRGEAIKYTIALLQQGLRGPGDGAIAAMRRNKPKKAHGSGQG